jgi:hypothetical protein
MHLIIKLKQLLRTVRVRRAMQKDYDESIAGLKLKKLSKEQKSAIQTYFLSKTGKKINTRWHQYLYTVNGNFDVRYLPLDLYYGTLLSKLNCDVSMCWAYADKNLTTTLLPNVLQPKTIIKNIQGLYYDSHDCPTTITKAICTCANLTDAIIKPTVCSGRGKNVLRFASSEGIVSTGESVEQLLSRYRKNFIIQEAVVQHPILSSLNPSSVNTIRIATYRRKEDVVLLYAIQKIGGKNSSIDNASLGGAFCKINDEGQLDKCAYTYRPAGVIEKTETGIKFSDIVIPSFSSIVEKAKQLHYRTPYSRIIGWDFAVNLEGEAVLIELNTVWPGLYQLAEPGLGKYTDEILESFFITKTI